MKRRDYQNCQKQGVIESLGLSNQCYTFDHSAQKGNRLLQKRVQSANKHCAMPSKNPYKVREEEFDKVYHQKLDEIRADADLQKSSPSKQDPELPSNRPDSNLDIALYKERNDTYKLISNRIKTRALMTDRKYLDKTNIKILEKFFDPLRIRLRVLPIQRAPLSSQM